MRSVYCGFPKNSQMTWYEYQWQPNSATSLPAVFCIPLLAWRYGVCCGIKTRLYQLHFHLTWWRNQHSLLPRGVADAGAAASDLQHCWRCLSFSKVMQQHIAIMSWLSYCAMRHSFINRDMRPANVTDLNTVDYHIFRCCLSEIQGATQNLKLSTFGGNSIT